MPHYEFSRNHAQIYFEPRMDSKMQAMKNSHEDILDIESLLTGQVSQVHNNSTSKFREEENKLHLFCMLDKNRVSITTC